MMRKLGIPDLASRAIPAAAALGAMLLLAGCAPSTGPMWGPNSPRNGAGQPVDPVYGTPIPGYTTPYGGIGP